MLFIFYLWTGLWTVTVTVNLVTAKEITLVGVTNSNPNPGGPNSESNFGPVSVVVKTDSGSFERDNQARVQDFELPSPAISRLIPQGSATVINKVRNVKSPILTPQQIQYFTNELLNLIGSKCSKVDGNKISQIKNYLSDVTNLDFSALKSFLPFLKSPNTDNAENLKNGQGADVPLPSWFESLINSLQTCVKPETPEDLTMGNAPEQEPEPETLLSQPKTEQEQEKNSKSSEEARGFFEMDKDPKPLGQESDWVSEQEQEQEQDPSEIRNQKQRKTPKPKSKTIIMKINEDEDEIEEQEHEHQHEQRKKSKKNPILNWLSQAFTNVTSFFKQAFTHAKKSLKGIGERLKRAKQSLLNHKDKDTGNNHNQEDKEKVKENPDPLFNLDLDSDSSPEHEELRRTRRRLRRFAPPSLTDLDFADLLNGIFNPSSQKAAGKQLLKQILRDAFRIYGRSCPNLTPSNIQAFRVTAKSFMNFIKQSEQLAFFITAVIDKNLAETIRQCTKDSIGLKRK